MRNMQTNSDAQTMFEATQQPKVVEEIKEKVIGPDATPMNKQIKKIPADLQFSFDKDNTPTLPNRKSKVPSKKSETNSQQKTEQD